MYIEEKLYLETKSRFILKDRSPNSWIFKMVCRRTFCWMAIHSCGFVVLVCLSMVPVTTSTLNLKRKNNISHGNSIILRTRLVIVTHENLCI